MGRLLFNAGQPSSTRMVEENGWQCESAGRREARMNLALYVVYHREAGSINRRIQDVLLFLVRAAN